MTVTMGEYYDMLRKFSKKHNRKAELKVYTSPMENDRYCKTYAWSDGATFTEINELITESVEVEIHGIKTIAEIEVWRTEFWSTEFPSYYTYEKA